MKQFKAFLFLSLLFMLSQGIAQTKTQLNGTIILTGVTILDETTYSIKGTFVDPGNNYSASDVQVGDRIIDEGGNTYEILTITSNFNPLTATIRSFNKGEIPAFGTGTLFKPTANGLPLVSNGSPASLLVSTINTATLTLDVLLPNYSKGMNLPSVTSAEGDVVMLASELKLYKLSNSGWTPISDAEIVDQYVMSPSSVGIEPKGSVIRMVFDNNKLFVSDGSAWIEPTQISELPKIPKYGDIFFVTGEGKLYMYDANSKWAGLGGALSGASLPASSGAKPGDTFYNTADNKLYLYNGIQWVPMDNSLAEGKLYIGDAAGIAVPADKNSIAISELGAATTSVSMGSNALKDVADPVDAQDASTKNYVDTKTIDPANIDMAAGDFLIGNGSGKAIAVAKSTIPISGFDKAAEDISMGNGTLNYKISNLADPVTDQDAATKKYVDSKISDPSSVTLADGAVLIGNSSNQAEAHIISGDITLDNAGVSVIADEAVGTAKIKGASITLDKLLTDGASDGNKVYVTDPNGKPMLADKASFGAGAGGETFADDFVVNGVANYLKWTNGQTVPAKGKTAVELLLEGSQMAVAPAYTAPSAGISGSPAAGSFEFGRNIGTITLSSTFTQNDAGALTGTTYSKNGVPLGANTDVISSLIAPVTYTVTKTYDQGPVKNNNLGTADPAGRIPAGSVTKTITYTPVASRYYGFVSSTSPTDAEVHSLTKDQTSTKVLKTTLTNPSTAKYICFRYPVGAGGLTAIKINGFSALGAFTITQGLFTNEQGYQSNYYLVIGNNPVDNSGAPSTDLDLQ